MEGTVRCTLRLQHTHSLEDHTRSIKQSTTTHTKHFHNIQQHPNILQIVSPNISQHCQTHKTDISINRATHKIQGYNITLTTTKVQAAIKQSKNYNSQGPDKLNIRH